MIKEKINSVVEKISNAIFVLEKRFIYTTLTDLGFTMRKYVFLVVNNDIKQLKRYRVPIRTKTLLKTFYSLMEEFSELSDNRDVKAVKEQKTHLENLVRKQNLLVSAYMVLSVMPNDENTLGFLHRSGIRGENITDRLENEIKVINLRIAEQEQIVKPKGGEKEHKKAELADYIAMFVVLNENGFKASMDMSVLEYIQTRKRYDAKVAASQEQLENIKKKR